MRRRLVIFLVLTALALIVWLAFFPNTSERLILNITTDKGSYIDKLHWFRTLAGRRDTAAGEFIIRVARDPYICFHPEYRVMASEPTGRTVCELVAPFQAFATQALPDEPTRDVLDVLIRNLTVKTPGRYCDSTFFIRCQCGTDPVRQYALRKLTSITGQDFEYDVARWKTFILDEYGYDL
jgi:hypothetical protein